MIDELALALRALRKRWRTSALAIACLAVGIGANVVLFGVIDALLFRPPIGVGDPSTLVRVRTGGPVTPLMAGAGAVNTYPTFEEVREQRRELVDIAAYGGGPATLDGGERARRVSTQTVTSNYFEVMGVRPVIGRFFDEAEGLRRAAVPVVVLGYDFWQSAFGGRVDALGSSLRVRDRTLTVVGVTPRGFVGADLRETDFWIPMGLAGEPGFGGGYGPGSGWIQMVARLRPGVTLDAARSRLAAESEGRESLTVIPFTEADIGRPTLPMPITLIPVRTMIGGFYEGDGPVPTWALGVSGALLLLACATVANLLLAEAARRRRDVAVRLSLGASPGRILRGQLIESLVVALAAVGCSALFAWLSLGLARRLPTPPLGPVLGARSALFGLVVALATPLVFGVLPAIWSARRDVAEVLKKSAGTATLAQLQRGLMAAQTAIAFVLLIVGGLFLGSLERIRAIPLGWDAESTIVVHLDLPEAWGDPERALLLSLAVDDLERVPGVVAVGTGQGLPFDGAPGGADLRIEDGRPDDAQPNDVVVDAVGAGYFRALDIPLLAGRAIDESDRGGRPVAVVSEFFAQRFMPGRSALGSCLYVEEGLDRGAYGGACAEVVGVTADARYRDLFGEMEPIVYLATEQVRASSFWSVILVRVDGRPEEFLQRVRDAVQGADPGMPAPQIESASSIMDRELFRWRVATGIFGVLGVLAAVLAGVGVYGLASFIADQRRRELGIRSALGAGRERLLALVLWDGGRVSGAGLLVGTAVALALGRVFASQLYGLSWAHPATYITVGAGLLLVTVAAGLRPALHASRVDPAVVLREDG
jgi:predicted permease